MDKFTRNYLIVLSSLLLIGLVWYFYESPEVANLNSALSNNAEVAAYPYRFRVFKVENGVATMGTPRSPAFAASQALVLLFPELKGVPVGSPEMFAAQQRMAEIQSKAGSIVMGFDAVSSVKWQLDEGWLRSNGVNPELL